MIFQLIGFFSFFFQQSYQHNHGSLVRQELDSFWGQFKGCYIGVLWAIELATDLGQDIMPLSILTSFMKFSYGHIQLLLVFLHISSFSNNNITYSAVTMVRC